MTTIDAAADATGAPRPRWHDPKRHLWLGGLLVPLLPFGGALLVGWTGWSLFWWFGPIWVFAVIPLPTRVWGTDTTNPPDWAVPQLEADRYYRWCTYLYIPLQLRRVRVGRGGDRRRVDCRRCRSSAWP